MRALPTRAVFSVLLLSTVALADDTVAAKAAAKAGRLAFDAGDFAAALSSYEEAFRLKPVPALQFNLGQCHRQLGHTERALYFFRRFLDSKPPEQQAAQVRPLIDELEAQLQKAEQLKAEEQAYQRQLELEHARATSAQAQAQLAERSAEEARRQAELERALKLQPADETPPPYQKAWFWVVVGGAAVLAAGVGAGVAVATAPKPLPTTWPDINAR
jgi:tetratricopeptide (TPR) repeat protein